jgi:hypothetical protein
LTLQTRQRWWIYDRWCERSRGKPQQPSDLLLDVDAMQQAAQQLLGLHDFSTFMDTKKPAGEQQHCAACCQGFRHAAKTPAQLLCICRIIKCMAASWRVCSMVVATLQAATQRIYATACAGHHLTYT